MYGLLRAHLPKTAADILMIIWYVALVFLIIAFAGTGTGEFRYLNI